MGAVRIVYVGYIGHEKQKREISRDFDRITQLSASSPNTSFSGS
jgi:hypothetical protein